MMRQDRFTEQAQTVLQSSQQMVREQRNAQWDVEHVFLALVRLKDGLARDLLQRRGVDVDAMARPVSAPREQAPTPPPPRSAQETGGMEAPIRAAAKPSWASAAPGSPVMGR